MQLFGNIKLFTWENGKPFPLIFRKRAPRSMLGCGEDRPGPGRNGRDLIGKTTSDRITLSDSVYGIVSILTITRDSRSGVCF